MRYAQGGGLTTEAEDAGSRPGWRRPGHSSSGAGRGDRRRAAGQRPGGAAVAAGLAGRAGLSPARRSGESSGV